MTLSFTIIVTSLDRKDMVVAAIESVRAQRYPDVEIIVADGGSRDGTLEAIESCPDLVLLRGPDGGVYDAWNKAMACATGDIIALLNSDDLYPAGTLAAVAASFAMHPDADAVCGRAELRNDRGDVVVYDNDTDKALRSPRTALLGDCVINARFFRRAAMARIGAFDVRYRYVSDRDWLGRWCELRMSTAVIGDPVYRYRQHTGSLTFDADRRHARAIYTELLALARRWRAGAAASPAALAAAVELEGRCLGRLALAGLGEGRIGDAVRLLIMDENSLSFSPLSKLVRAAAIRFTARRS